MKKAAIMCLAGLLTGLIASCDDRPRQFAGSLDRDDIVFVKSIGTNAVYLHRNMSALQSLQPLIVSTIDNAFDSVSSMVPVTNLQVRVMVFPDPTLPAFGLSGVAGANRIDIFLDADHPGLEEGIRTALLPTFAHEYHHVLRDRTVGYGETLFDAIVSEGLAERFTQEVTGEPPPWMGPVNEDRIAYWRTRAAGVWCRTEFDHAAWFVGSTGEIPRGTGFMIGYHIVGEYLAAHPMERPSTLYAAPAAGFLPQQEEDNPAANCWKRA